MAKETMIIFVYDTQCCKDEADDPISAVLYFHPSWVSDTQKHALCGQLMGTSFFLKDCFFKPNILALQNGKFVFKEFGRFILAVGTDRNISDHLLEYRAELLSSLIMLFHCDLQTIYDQFSTNGHIQHKNLKDKLYYIFETYLPILQYTGNVFQNVPKLKIPRSASNIFLDAIQTLQCCQQNNGILGGVVLYHNKVIATQLPAGLTKNLVLTDPHRMKSIAEQIASVDFHVPIGVQILITYITENEYRQLVSDANRLQNLKTKNISHSNLQCQYQKQRKIKRDKSLIFSNIPEETVGAPSEALSEECPTDLTMQTGATKSKTIARPNHLPLRTKNITSKDLPESGFASINFDETDSFPEFIGRTSVCSTPMTGNKVLHENIMSICANQNESISLDGTSSIKKKKTDLKFKFDFDNFFSNFKNSNNLERRNSFTDLQDSIKKLSKKLSIRKFSDDVKISDADRNESCNSASTPNFSIDNEDSEEFNDTPHTISDPTYPVFNSNGKQISRSLFQDIFQKYNGFWNENSKEDKQITELIEGFKEFDSELKKLNYGKEEAIPKAEIPDQNMSENSEQSVLLAKTQLDKKSMTLPLKPISENAPSKDVKFNITERVKIGGIPLTPLMAKLSVLALNDDRSVTQCYWDLTPGIEQETTSKVFRRSIKKNENTTNPIISSSQIKSNNDLKKVELYVCGQQNMTMFLLMEEGSGQKQETVQTMFDICVAKMARMESQLNQTLNININGDKSDQDYSFICIDSNWDALHRCGPWTPVDTLSLEYIHRDFKRKHHSLTDLLLRLSDSVLYGHKLGRREFFYKEVAHQTTGIPLPSDPMANLSMRAKRRLERDYAYILL